jgi:hypothetical protein
MKPTVFTSILVLAAVSGFAQTTSTSILGTVIDASGSSVADATVTALEVDTGIKREQVTSSAGNFNFPLLNPGTYEVTVTKSGFKTETRPGVLLELNQKARVDFTLQVGAVTERVEIQAAAPILNTEDASLGLVVNTRTIEELPMNGRNIGSLAVLQPGVFFGGRMGYDGGVSGTTGTGGGVPIPGDTIAISANGQRDTDQHATLDGVSVTEARVNTVPFTPSVEAIEEFKVLAGTYSAEYGTHAGAQLTMVLKSGTNQFHGTAFEFLRNDKLDAEDYFQNYFNAPGAARKPKNQLRQNQFGGVLSGPILVPKIYNGKNRTFFMFDYEGRRRRQPGGIGTANVPSATFRNGDLSALLNRQNNTTGAPLPAIQIFDPITGAPFPGNIIPPDRIQPAAKALAAFWPAAQRINSDPLSGVNYIGTGNVEIDDDQKFVRIDHEISSKDKIFGHYVIDDISYTLINAPNPNFNYFVVGRNQSVAGQYIHIFSPTLVNEFRFGYNRSVDNTLNPRSNTSFSLDALGLTGFRVLTDNNRPFTAREAGVPPISVQGFSTLSDQDGGNGFDFNQQWQWSDNVSFNRGLHNFKGGIDVTRIALFRGAANVPRGDVMFNGDVAGNAFAAFLLGVPSQTDSPEGLPLTDSRQTRYGLYFLDDWKVGRRLTLNLGLRWEYNTSAVDIDGLWRSLDFRHEENGLPVLVPLIRTKNYQFYTPEKTLFMPRIGFAYRPTDKWVVRGGGGIYYNVHQLNNYTILNLNPPLSGSSAFVNTPVSGVLKAGTPVYTFQNPFGALSPTSIINANTLNPDNWEPRIMQWSFDIQRQLPMNSVFTLGYVGNHGVHIDNTVELNNPDPAPNTTTTAQQRRPYQSVVDGPGGLVRPLSRIRWLDSGGGSWYHGLQADWQKRFSKGLQFNVAYTYSKAEGTGYGRNESFGATNNGSYQNPRNRAADKSVYPFDVAHNAVINFIYEIPTVPGLRNNFGRHILGGWQANGIWTMRTGFPFTVQQSNTLNTFNSPVRPDRLGSGSLSNPTINLWYNPDAFQIVTCNVAYLLNTCHYGNSGNGILRGPGFNDFDLGLTKNFRLTERSKLQFRAESFNIANRPNFNTPNTTLTAGPGYYPTQNTTTGAIGPYPTQVSSQGPGSITSLISPMRVIQFGLKVSF